MHSLRLTPKRWDHFHALTPDYHCTVDLVSPLGSYLVRREAEHFTDAQGEEVVAAVGEAPHQHRQAETLQLVHRQWHAHLRAPHPLGSRSFWWFQLVRSIQYDGGIRCCLPAFSLQENIRKHEIRM